MTIFIYLSLSILFFISAFFIVYFRLRYFYKYPNNYDEEYDGHEKFLDNFFVFIHNYIFLFYKVLKVLYTNILHLWVLITEKIKYIFDQIYKKSRDRFIKEAVKDKTNVSQFWDHLKKYKKEKDAESRIDDDSINLINK